MNYVKYTFASALGAVKRVLGFAPPPPIRKRPRKALIVWAVYSRALRAGLPTTGLRTAANGYKRKSRAGVPQCRCNQRDTPKCKKPTCPKFGVPKQGSPGNWHHP